MALNTRNIDIVFTEGINQKLDNKSTDLAVLLTLENRVFTKVGSLNKRFGYTEISELDCDNVAITDMNTLAKFGEDELVLFASNKFYSYSQAITMRIILR